MIDIKCLAMLLVAIAPAIATANYPAQLGDATTTVVDPGRAPRRVARMTPKVGTKVYLTVDGRLISEGQPPTEFSRALEIGVERVEGERVTLRIDAPFANVVGTAVVTTRGGLISLEATAPPSDDKFVHHTRQAILAHLDLVKEAWGLLGDLAPQTATGAGARWRATRTIVKGPLPTTFTVELTHVAGASDERLATRATFSMAGKLPAPVPPLDAMTLSGSGNVEIALLPTVPWPRRLSIAQHISSVIGERGRADQHNEQAFKAELDFTPAPSR